MGDFWGQGAEEFVIAGDPDEEDGLKAFGAREICGEPDFFEGFEDLGLGVEGSPAWFLVLGFSESLKFSQDPDGVFAVIA